MSGTDALPGMPLDTAQGTRGVGLLTASLSAERAQPSGR